MFRIVSSIALITLIGFTLRAYAQVTSELPPELKGIGVEEKLGTFVPDTLMFFDEEGRPVSLANFLAQDKPVILNFVYYNCPMLCSYVLDGLTKGLQELNWTPGEKFEIITLSFAPDETPEQAQKAKKRYLSQLGKPAAAKGWHFLTADARTSTTLAEQVGFQYRWDERTQQYIHPAALVFLSPEGKISRYLYGIEFPGKDLRLALTEASEGKIGSATDRVLLYCYQYDPDSGSYVPVATNIMKLGGLLTLLLLGSLLGAFWLRERYRKQTA